ncbi:hypothetical protein E5206_18540 [Arthrobacter sp. PAMC25564]|uniref:hypothetical protein n=1 Tax=Arthrobacter sp. PAMC25564 TaxID=2565366 RepID=UPI0010A273DC|nr:hypothetical protein [Arthrobacter sp. PAMC25564]QCB98658.1 hypothetical protein E5206_18540 [Arthrobacter sp. PAMC25564]
MDNTGSIPIQPRETVESDPAYDFADDTPIDDEKWDEESEQEELVDEDERAVPLDADEFREPEEQD